MKWVPIIIVVTLDFKTPPPPPAVLWAQRHGYIFVTISLEDCKNPNIKIEPDTIFFSGIGGTEKKLHEVTIYLYEPIDATGSKSIIMDRTIELILKKVNQGPFWPRLTKDKNKYHWLKVNFAKWKDEEDESDFESDEDNLENMMKSMGGIENVDGRYDSDENGNESDSDSENVLPDLE